MSIPFHQHRDNPGEIDLLVPAQPLWETAWLVDELPSARFDADLNLATLEDGGGSSLNSACALAAVGRRVVAVGSVGEDAHGRRAIEALTRRGVEARVEILPGQTTVRTHLFVERITGRTAFQAFLPENRAHRRQSELPHLGVASVLLLDRPAEGAVAWLRLRRSQAGLRNVLNLNEPSSAEGAWSRLSALLPFLDIVQIPEASGPAAPRLRTDPTRMAGPHRPTDPTAVHRPRPHPALTKKQVTEILDAGVGILIRTRGAGGVTVQSAGETAHTTAAPTSRVVDPTGAGDAFTAGFLDALLSGGTSREAAAHGVDWAARAIRHLGARSWLDLEPPEPFASKVQKR